MKFFEIVAVRNPFERFFLSNFLIIIPCVYIFRCLSQFIVNDGIPDSLLDFPKILSEVAVIIALIFSNILLSQVRLRLSQLYLTGIVIPKPVQSDIYRTDHWNTFLEYFDSRLNSQYRIIIGFIVALIVFYYYVLRVGGFSQLILPDFMAYDYFD
jgi:hypothetical protein